jgi:hypothetical protein
LPLATGFVVSACFISERWQDEYGADLASPRLQGCSPPKKSRKPSDPERT